MIPSECDSTVACTSDHIFLLGFPCQTSAPFSRFAPHYSSFSYAPYIKSHSCCIFIPGCLQVRKSCSLLVWLDASVNSPSKKNSTSTTGHCRIGCNFSSEVGFMVLAEIPTCLTAFRDHLWVYRFIWNALCNMYKRCQCSDINFLFTLYIINHIRSSFNNLLYWSELLKSETLALVTKICNSNFY